MRIHYKKTWQFEGQALTDRSTVGVYFAPEQEAQELLTLPITSPPLPAADANRTITFSRTIDEDMQALALGPIRCRRTSRCRWRRCGRTDRARR